MHRNQDLGMKTIYCSDRVFIDATVPIDDGEIVSLINHCNIKRMGDDFIYDHSDHTATEKKILWIPYENYVQVFIKKYNADNECQLAEYLGESAMKTIKKGDYVQLLKMNYYICDDVCDTGCCMTLIEVPT